MNNPGQVGDLLTLAFKGSLSIYFMNIDVCYFRDRGYYITKLFPAFILGRMQYALNVKI